MKHTLLSIIAFALFSCNSNSKSSTETTEITDSPENTKTAVAFKTIRVQVPFSGSWISETYLQQIAEHQSPRKAQEGSEDVYIMLPQNTLQTTAMVYNFHEAISDLVMTNRNGHFELWEKQNDTLSNVKYTIEKLADDKIKIGQKTFIKIDPVVSGDQPRILEVILFAGTYTSKEGLKVEFKRNGEVTGLGSFKYYRPVIDYYDAGLEVDQVGLGQTPDQMEYFGFKFQKNNLDLYKLKCKEVDPVDNRCLNVAFGTKVYELKK